MKHDDEQIRLAGLYASMNDGELESLAEDWDSLIEAGHQALKEEMARRGMHLSLKTEPSPEEEGEALTDPVTVAEFPDMSEALLAQGLLASGGIPSALSGAGDTPSTSDQAWFGPRSGSGLGHLPGVNAGIRLQVNSADAETAREVLEQPLQDQDSD
jgi:hypothetical protein